MSLSTRVRRCDALAVVPFTPPLPGSKSSGNEKAEWEPPVQRSTCAKLGKIQKQLYKVSLATAKKCNCWHSCSAGRSPHLTLLHIPFAPLLGALPRWQCSFVLHCLLTTSPDQCSMDSWHSLPHSSRSHEHHPIESSVS